MAESGDVQSVIRSSIEVAQRVARESLDASSGAAKEIQAAVKRALDAMGASGATQ